MGSGQIKLFTILGYSSATYLREIHYRALMKMYIYATFRTQGLFPEHNIGLLPDT